MVAMPLQKLQLSQAQRQHIADWRTSVHRHMQNLQNERHAIISQVTLQASLCIIHLRRGYCCLLPGASMGRCLDCSHIHCHAGRIPDRQRACIVKSCTTSTQHAVSGLVLDP